MSSRFTPYWCRLRRPHDARAAEDAVTAAVDRFELVDVDLIPDVEYDDAHAGQFLRRPRALLRPGRAPGVHLPAHALRYTPFGRAPHERRREHEVLAEASRLAADHGYERRSV